MFITGISSAWRPLALVTALVASTFSASAGVLQLVYTGSVTAGIDETGVFGVAGADLANAGYLATFLVDTSLGTRTTDANNDQVEGGLLEPMRSPVLSAEITINGVSYAFGVDYLGYERRFNNGLNASSGHTHAEHIGATGFRSIGNALDIASNLSSPLIPLDLDTPYSTDTSFGNGSFVTYDLDIGRGVYLVHAFGSLTADHVTVSRVQEVPEPASVSLLLVALALLATMKVPRSRAGA
jgi:hypothetical protein